MPFPLEHWKNPRKTIANRFETNDIAYATHGAIIAMEALKAIDKPFLELRNLTLLDYGCGTGRAARVLSKAFKHVYAYDPVQECIDMAHKECEGIEFPNVTYTSDFNTIPKCNLAISINVIEHLSANDAEIMINNLRTVITDKSYVWYFAKRNARMLAPYMLAEWKEEDTTILDTIDDKMMIRGFKF